VRMYLESDTLSFHPPLSTSCKRRDGLVDAQMHLPPLTGIWFFFLWRLTSTCYIAPPIRPPPNTALTTKASLLPNCNKPCRFSSYQNAVFNLLLRPFPLTRLLLLTLPLPTMGYHVVTVVPFVWVTILVFFPRCVVWEYSRSF
jgi:hypothetical protein